jgi:hypothetical protein
MLFCRRSDANEPSKVAEQKMVNVLATASGAAISAPPPLVGASLMACSDNDAKHSSQRVLRYLESLKDVEADQKGNRSSFHCFMLLVLLLTLFFLLM